MKRFHLLLCCCLISFPCFAFGHLGHQLVAYIAQQNLTPTVTQRVSDILDGKSLVDVASWADKIRDQKQWQHTGPWHYLNIDKGKTLAQQRRSAKGDVLSQLEYFERQLAQAASHNKQQQALKFYVHLLADLHQPLHLGYAQDRGGNTRKISWYGKPSNLHRVWDSQLLNTRYDSPENYAKWLIKHYSKQTFEIHLSYPQWIAETRQLVPQAYQFSSPRLGQSYVNRHRASLELQIVKAGLRLAAKLNQQLG
ncbi:MULTISPECIES: S1/P1 nuclease [unclassified Agarivorans]|uniref:S1/P1 nuclease n=1 Tax=unclassified Agarivorans TaxID=2636026 RepID=UPI003D7C606C